MSDVEKASQNNRIFKSQSKKQNKARDNEKKVCVCVGGKGHKIKT